MNQLAVKKSFSLIDSLHKSFNEIAENHKAVKFTEECLFAKEALSKNSFLETIAERNPDSLRHAILNVAAAGITLNPIHKKAFLVPREGRVCLDISYPGLIAIATDGGSIVWVQSQVVREKDTFVYHGIDKKPDHDMHPFQKRGEILGFYCVAKTKGHDYLTHMMSVDQINAIMERSEAYKAYVAKKVKSCPWVTDYEEMAKKTVIKQAYKLWPKTTLDARLAAAVAAENDANGINFTEESAPVETAKPDIVDYHMRDSLISEIGDLLGKKTKGFIPAEKFSFMVEHCGVDSFNHLKKKGIEDLKIIISKLIRIENPPAETVQDKPQEAKTPEVIGSPAPSKRDEKKQHRTARDCTFKLEN